MKTIIMMIGAGATGKSTLSRVLAGEQAVQHHVDLSIMQKGERKRFKAPYVLGSDIAIAGNLKNTSDAIGAMDALYQTIDHCLKERDTVITDGFRCTQTLVRWIQDHPLKPAALFVLIDLSLDSNLTRLRGRRSGNGIEEHKLPPKTFLNVLRFRERSQSVWNYARHHYRRKPVRFKGLPEGMKPEESAEVIKAELDELEKSAAQVEVVADSPVSASMNFNGQWHEHLYDLSPVELIGGVWWKRDDLFAPLGVGSVNGSKLRQLIWLVSNRTPSQKGVTSGAVKGSPQHAMVAAVAQHYGIPCVQFVGGESEDPPMVALAKKYGAEIRHANPGYAGNLNAQARKLSAERGWFHIETNITVEHDRNPAAHVEAFHRVGSEQCRNIPGQIENLFVPAGSCNSLTSILYGLARFRPKSLKTVHLFRIMKNADEHRRWTNERLDVLRKFTGEQLELPYKFVEHQLVDSGFCTYEDMMPFIYKELEFHPRYEGKCLTFIKQNPSIFKPLMNDKTLFWIIGSMPTCTSLTKHRAASAN